MILYNSHTVVNKALLISVKSCWLMQFAEVAPISMSALQGVCQKCMLYITVVCVCVCAKARLSAVVLSSVFILLTYPPTLLSPPFWTCVTQIPVMSSHLYI